ncbi:hypothetical protein EZS27_010739 [termite gut metagenome]|uniref:Uncharacterized protein n=1 Tax=termite gut metagenome TaxID=433724 RepID=A0A5J4S6N0_9ZZZZ
MSLFNFLTSISQPSNKGYRFIYKSEISHLARIKVIHKKSLKPFYKAIYYKILPIGKTNESYYR